MNQAFEDADRVLTDPNIPWAEKRRVLGMIIRKVVPRKEGADIVFHPGVFPQLEPLSTFHTTCIGIKTQR